MELQRQWGRIAVSSLVCGLLDGRNQSYCGFQSGMWSAGREGSVQTKNCKNIKQMKCTWCGWTVQYNKWYIVRYVWNLLKPMERKNCLRRDKNKLIFKVKKYVRVWNVYLFSQKAVSYKSRCGVCLTGKDRKGILYVITLSIGKGILVVG